MKQLKATRAELLAKKNQIALARRGRDLLTEKRNALLKELMRTARQIIRHSYILEERVNDAAATLALAKALDGPQAVYSAALAGQGEVNLTVSGTSIMGVAVPAIERRTVTRNPLDRGYSLQTVSSRIEDTAAAFEGLLDLIIELAVYETRLRRLAEEISRTSRRVNALSNVLIPRLEAEYTRIQMVLDEHERENLFRLKRIKMKLERTSRALIERE